MTIRKAAALAAVLACAAAWGPARAAEPIITTFAGGGSGPGNGDGGPATSAQLHNPIAVATDATGNVYVAEGQYFGDVSCRVRRIARNGIITTIAGDGSGYPGGQENVPATSVAVCPHGGLAVDAQGNVYVGEKSRVRRITPGGTLSTVAGSWMSGFSGDGGPATSAQFSSIRDVAVDAAGHLYIVDGNRVRKVDGAGIVDTIAGNGTNTASGDGGPATDAGFAPGSIAIDSDGHLYIADADNRSIRRVTPDGIIHPWAGGRFRSDPVAANVQQYDPAGIAVDARGNLYIANHRHFVRIIGANGIQTNSIAGVFNDTKWSYEGAPPGFEGDGGPAVDALLSEPRDVAVDAAGNVYVADLGNQRIRKITPVAAPAMPAGVDAFSPGGITAVGSLSRHVAVGDVNGDGRLDAILATGQWFPSETPENDWKLHAFLQKADGTLAAPIKRDMGYGEVLGGLAVADLNEDGRADAIVTDANGVQVHPGGTTGFGIAVPWPGTGTAMRGGAVAVGDLDRDGHTDVLAFIHPQQDGSGSGTGLTIFYGDGHGGVARRRLVQVGDALWTKPLLFDATGDGLPDLVLPWGIAGGYDSGLLVFPHDTVDSFSLPLRLHAGERGFTSGLAAGDFDGDGRRDLIVSRDDSAPESALAYFRQVSHGKFELARVWPTYDGASTLKGADMNTDGRDDLLVLHNGEGALGYWEQSPLAGQSWLHAEVKYPVIHFGTVAPDVMAIGDLNSDDCPDVALADSSNGLQVLPGRHCLLRARNGSAPLLPSIIRWPGESANAAATGEAPPSVPMPVAGEAALVVAGTATSGVARDIPRPRWFASFRSLLGRFSARLEDGWRKLAGLRAGGAAAPARVRSMPWPAVSAASWQPIHVCRAGDPWTPGTSRIATHSGWWRGTGPRDGVTTMPQGFGVPRT